MGVKPKKHLGQHFLTNPAICDRIAQAVSFHENNHQVIEIGPGTGALTKFLLQLDDIQLKVVDLDRESIEYLKTNFDGLKEEDIHYGDFLKMDLDELFKGEIIIVGNFPYNISSQILFKIYEERSRIPEMVGMFQKEVAERVCSGPGNKNYGILSVLLQAFYEVEYLFTVSENEFNPPPKVKSGVMQMKRRDNLDLPVDPKFFKRVVKMAFNQRRKTLRNSLKSIIKSENIDASGELFNKRPEQLDVDNFLKLCLHLQGE